MLRRRISFSAGKPLLSFPDLLNAILTTFSEQKDMVTIEFVMTSSQQLMTALNNAPQTPLQVRHDAFKQFYRACFQWRFGDSVEINDVSDPDSDNKTPTLHLTFDLEKETPFEGERYAVNDASIETLSGINAHFHLVFDNRPDTLTLLTPVSPFGFNQVTIQLLALSSALFSTFNSDDRLVLQTPRPAKPPPITIKIPALGSSNPHR